jgi:hypothetical protein
MSPRLSFVMHRLLDHLVGGGQQRFRDGEAEALFERSTSAYTSPTDRPPRCLPSPASGLVPRLDRPSGNVTGFATVEASMGGKWLECSPRSLLDSSGPQSC